MISKRTQYFTMKVTAERFIEVWAGAVKNGHNLTWVARQLGIGETPVRQRAERMRKQGVKLPELAKYRASDAKRLNRIMEKKLAS